MARKQVAPPQPGPRLIGYARVSTEEQRLDLQLDAIRKAGVEPDDIYVEKVSGASRRRPELDLCIKALREGDTLIIWRLDRLSRGMQDLYERLRQIANAKAKLRSLQEDFDFGTYMGEFVLGIFGLVAQLERRLIAQRTTAGIEAARARGWSPGRKVRFTDKHQARAKADLRAGMSVKDVAEKYNVSTSLLHQRGLYAGGK